MDDESLNSAKTIRSGGGDSLGRIDQYELLNELGGGGFGTVYLARDTVAGIEVAVKGLPPTVKNNREELENIRANFALVSRLTHTNIAKALVLHPAKDVYYSSEDVRQKLRVLSGDMLMVMEYAPGETLSQWRKRFTDRRVPLDKALEVTRQIASALDYAHERKIVHRDIKPANIMIETKPDDGIVARVLDFGLAAEIRSSMGRISQEVHDTSGTRPYMAPEQWSGERQGAATDQYSLAVLFHELVTGSVPFASVFDTGDPVVMMNVVGNKPFKASSDLPKFVRHALEKALSKKPEERFANCGEFVKALEVESSNNSLKLVLVAALLAALCGVGALWWNQYDRHDETKLPTEVGVPKDVAPPEKIDVPEPITEPEPPVDSNSPVALDPVETDPPIAEPEVVTPTNNVVNDEKAEAEAARNVVEAARKAAMEIRIEAMVKRGLVDKVADDDGFRELKIGLETDYQRANAFCDDKIQRWSEAALLFTNYIKQCECLLAQNEKRMSRAVKRPEPVKVKIPVTAAAPKPKARTDSFVAPTLTVVAELDGREVSGAIMQTMSDKVSLPYEWNGARLEKGRSFGPYLVTYSEGGQEYAGDFSVTVDWNGHAKKVVALRRMSPGETPGGVRPEPKGRGGWILW